MKHINYTLLLLLIFLSGCNKEEWTEPTKGITATISTQYANSIGMQTNDVDNAVNTLSGYICENGSVKWISHELKSNTDKVWLPGAYKNGILYMVANKSLCPDIDRIVVGSSESELLGITNVSTEYLSPTSLLMTNILSIAEMLNKEVPIINLRRNVVRFDLSLGSKASDKVILHSITINGIPLSGSVFARETIGETTQTASKTFTFTADNQPSELQTLFYCQEFDATSQTPLTISIDASYNGVHALSHATVSAVKRNYIYKLLISAPNGIITSDIMYGDLESGADVPLDKPNQAPLLIDPDNSIIPSNCKISDDKSQVIFDSRGGEATIAFDSSNDPVKLISSHTSIRDFAVTRQADGRFLIKVGKYGTEIAGEDPAAVMYFAKEKEADNLSRHYAITVLGQYYAPFDFVTMGGLEWMQVNSSSLALHDYLAVEKNRDYKELYKNKWTEFASKGVQWGPRPGHPRFGYVRMAASEYVYYSYGFDYYSMPVANGAIIGGNNCKSWDGFCPEGWRLPLYDEFARIWPAKDATIPVGSNMGYTTSYGSFTARIEKLGDNCLIINDGTNEIIFPIAGFRLSNGVRDGKFDWDGWNVGTEAHYWCRDRINSNGRTYGIKPNNISDIREEDAANWNQVRCVRDIKE